MSLPSRLVFACVSLIVSLSITVNHVTCLTVEELNFAFDTDISSLSNNDNLKKPLELTSDVLVRKGHQLGTVQVTTVASFDKWQIDEIFTTLRRTRDIEYNWDRNLRTSTTVRLQPNFISHGIVQVIIAFANEMYISTITILTL